MGDNHGQNNMKWGNIYCKYSSNPTDIQFSNSAYRNLFLCPSVKIYWFYFWDMNSKISVYTSTSNAEKYTYIPRSPPGSCNEKKNAVWFFIQHWYHTVVCGTQTSDFMRSQSFFFLFHPACSDESKYLKIWTVQYYRWTLVYCAKKLWPKISPRLSEMALSDVFITYILLISCILTFFFLLISLATFQINFVISF